MRGVVLAMTVVALLVAAPSMAQRLDPSMVPSIGSTAPAFGLEAFRARGEEDTTRAVVQLDDHCGVRPGGTSTVLVAFVNNVNAVDDFKLLTQWSRKYSRDGFEVIVISTEPDPASMIELVAKSRGSFPVLDDQFGIVAHRYGLSGPPFSLLLDRECRVLGMSDKSITVDSDRLETSLDERSKAARSARK